MLRIASARLRPLQAAQSASPLGSPAFCRANHEDTKNTKKR